MPIAVEQSLTNTVAGTSIALSSWTPQANELLLVWVCAKTKTLTPSVSGNGLTWVQIGPTGTSNSDNETWLFHAQGASPSAGAVTVTLTGNADNAAVIGVRLSGAATGGTNGSEAVEATNTAFGNDTNLKCSVTTLTADAVVMGLGSHSNDSYSLQGSETAIAQNLTSGSGGARLQCSIVYIAASTTGSYQLGADGSLGSSGPWAAIVASIKPAASGYDDLVASQSTFTLTGQSATLLYGRNATANQSTFALTGQSASLLYGRSIAANQSAFTLTGQNTAFLRGYVVDAVQASFALSGNTASLIADRIVIGDQGSTTLTGQTAVLRYGRFIAASQSTFAITGQDVSFLRGYVVGAAQASFALSGSDVSFIYDRVIQAVSAVYTLTGIDVNLTYSESGSYGILADLGSVALTGQNAGMIVARLLTADQSSVALAGQNVPLLHGRKIAAIQASYALAGQSIGLLTHRRIDADQSSIIATWSTTLFLRTWLIVASQDTFTLIGQTVTLTYSGITLTPAHRTYVIDAENRIYVINSENRTYLIEV